MDQKEILENTNFIVAPLIISLLEHQASIFAGLNPNTNLNSANNKVNFDITKDPILNIGDKEIKIVEKMF